MATRSFVHLHCHSHYSLLDGASRVPELVAHAKSLGMNALAMTDHGNLFGAIEFYRECTDAGIKPIVGYEAYVAPTTRTDRTMKKRGESGYHLTLLAQNLAGFKNLVKMASIAYLEGYHYIPRIDKDLLEAHSDGIICLSGCASSEFSDYILLDQLDKARNVAEWFSKIFGANFYVEIQNNGLDIQKRCADGAIDIANDLGLPLVATSDAHYLKQEDNYAHDVLLCINTGRLLKDENRMKYGSDQFYVRPPEEMYKLFPDQEAAVKRSQEIADKVDLKLDFKKRHFPVFTPPEKKTPEKYLRELCEIGLLERYGPGASPGAQARLELAKARLKHELDIICKMGFAGYFLITWDFVRFAISKNIPAGARGSACGAIVSYVLKLSHVCPLEYDLLFERFLDPNRSEAPDIDIDFCQDNREAVIQYVRERYGEESVAQIGTFGTMAAKAAIKDVGRVLDVPLERVNRLTAMVPKVLNITLEESLKQSPDLKREYDSDGDIRKLIDIAMKLEGTNRNAGTHAAGVVIANGPITDYVPVQRMQRKDGKEGVLITTQWVMGDLEKVGMLKMDFLGLRTLTVIENTLKNIWASHVSSPRARHSEPARVRSTSPAGLEEIRERDPRTYELFKVGLNAMPLTDKNTYELLQRGDARGVFQLESDGIRELLKRMKPDNIRDLIATNALYRPGPLSGGMVDAYVNRKHGREKPTYAHPIMEPILRETYGILVYQEQCMQILNQLGGIELASAYACIKAISKKKEDVINARRVDFLSGALERGVAAETAKEIFDLICHFGGYGFNKSHSAAYAKLGYQTAYLKTHYPAEFMAALLTSEIEDSNKRDIMVEHMHDARKLGAEVLPPNIQEGEAEFTVKEGRIVFGLLAIKGLGRGAAEEIVRARKEQGPFKDFFDFCERIDQKIIPKAAIERLIKVGAFDCTGAKRAQLWDALGGALQAASQAQEDKRHGQLNLFDAVEATTEEANGHAAPNENLRNLPEWPALEKLKYEKESLDFYISSHPLGQYEEMLKRFSTHAAAALRDCEPNQEVFMGGMLTVVRLMNTKNARNGNSRYARFKLEDFSGAFECVMWPDVFVKYKDLVEEDKIVFVAGAVERKMDQPILVATRIVSMEQGQLERTTGLVLQMDLTDEDDADLRKLESIKTVLGRARGHLPVFLYIRDGSGKWLRMKAGTDWCVNPTTISKADLETILGLGRVEFSRQGNGMARA